VFVAGDVDMRALRAVEQLLEDQPDKIGHDFSEALRALTVWRNELLVRWRETQADVDQQSLGRLNAVLSVLMGGQFPIGAVPWPHIQHARDELAALAATATGAPS
jgi:hypothetical protein